ncbi:MAG: hypothetical protein ABW022_13920 [Actinoplanes sp.]
MPVLDAHALPRQSHIAPYRCGGCTSTWTGLAMAHCSACHETFAGVSGFDQHRLRGHCCPPAERGLALDAHGVWRNPNARPAGSWGRSRARD